VEGEGEWRERENGGRGKIEGKGGWRKRENGERTEGEGGRVWRRRVEGEFVGNGLDRAGFLHK
jgi:hypothetical protein